MILTDEQLMEKFRLWDGRRGYLTADELRRVIELAAVADPELLKRETLRATVDLAEERGMSVPGLLTVMRKAVDDGRR